MRTLGNTIGAVALAAATAAGTAVATGCGPDTWLADPGISPAVLAANGYRVVTRQTVLLPDGRQAIETRVENGPRRAKCRAFYAEDGTPDETVCYLPCRDG